MAGDRFNANGLSKSMRVITLPAYATGGTVTTIAPDGTTSTATVAANTAVQILPANADRRNFRAMVKDVDPAEYAYRANLAPGGGWPMDSAAALNGQGGSDTDAQPHTGAIYAVSAAGTTIAVIEG